MEIDGATILVTGASSGIGATLAPMLAARGATVGIVARRPDRLAQVLEQCRAHTPESQMWVADLGDLAVAGQVARAAWDAFGHLDVLVNNAAVPKRRRVTELTNDEIDEVMRIDFTSPVRMTTAILPRMLARDRGVIVNVSSLGGRLGIVHETAYCAAKFALCGWSEALAMDLWETGVRVRLIIPGPIATEIWDQPDNEPSLFEIDKVPAEECAAGIADALAGDGFEYYVPAEFPGGLDPKAMVVGKTQACDDYVRGMGDFAKALREG